MSATARSQVFSAVHTIGGLLPADMLVRISEGKDVSGSGPADYRVVGARSVPDDAERHWDYLKSIWLELRQKLPVAAEAQAPADPTGLAVRDWLEPLFNALGFGRLTAVGAAGISTDDGNKTFPISHTWQHVPIHLIGWNAKLDTRSAPGAVPPQSLVQECLNRTDNYLWAVLANGRQLRLLRDSSALATASYVEFDLEAIFDGELFSEFVLLYRLLHVSRFEVAEGATPSSCWLEKWRLEAITSGTRALDHLRDGVQQAITTLGTGFLRHPANSKLREGFDAQAFHNALLRLAYRMLFLFVIEDRDVLHPPGTDQQARERYIKYFSTARLRQQARRRRGTTHSDLYQALTYVVDALGDEQGRPELGLPGLGGIFTGKAGKPADEPLRGLALQNEYLLTAVRHLAQVRDPGSRRWRSVDYRNLGAEELGSIYESLLELVPRHRPEDRSFTLETLAGNTRKTTGSYYTPSSLIECLLDSALDPVIDDAAKRGEQAASAAGDPDPTSAIVNELLGLRVCDPACGSGHFLVAAARRIAKRVAAVRERNPEPTIDAVSHALHEVIATCIFGVDLNPMAVELAKVSLWLEGMEAGKALSFLDAHIKRGNALLGTTPALLRDGIPDAAFKPIEGDDKKHAKGLEKQNAEQRSGQGSFFEIIGDPSITNSTFAAELIRITGARADRLGQVRDQESAYLEWSQDEDYRQARLLADAWCAAFTWRKTEDAPPAITQQVFRSLVNADIASVSLATYSEIERLREQYAFFHWHLEFPDIFTVREDTGPGSATGWDGGFHCIVGNPPWDSVDLKEQEFFAQRLPAIAGAATATERKKLISSLKSDIGTRDLFAEFDAAKRASLSQSHFLRDSGRLPLTGQGNLNTYAVFAETGRTSLHPQGRAGLVLPTGIATDARTQFFFKDLVKNESLASIFDFENRDGLFPDVDSRARFSVMSITGTSLRNPAVELAFFLHDPAQIAEPGRVFSLSTEEISILNPNSGTCPAFRGRRDAELTLEVYSRIPILLRDDNVTGNPWGIRSAQGLFNLSHDSALFRTAAELETEGWTLTGNIFTKGAERMLPLYEAKMVSFFDHRAADVVKSGTAAKRQNQPGYLSTQDHDNKDRLAQPNHWVKEAEVTKKLRSANWRHDWLLGYCDVTSATNERSVIPALVPSMAVGHTFPLLFPACNPKLVAALCAVQSSLAFDFLGRQKIAGVHLTLTILKQLPVPLPSMLEAHVRFMNPRIIELAYTATDMAGLAVDLGDVAGASPFRWDEARRAQIRAELDAYCFHLYGIGHDDADYILESFQTQNGGLKNNEITKYGSYRTKELVLAEYDRMAAAKLSLTHALVDGENYTSTLDLPPGQGRRHPAR